MLDLLNSFPDIEVIKNFLGEAAGTEFTKTCAIFGFAAMIHAKQVRKEIRTQFGELVSVLQKDLSAQQSVLAGLALRVDTLESRFKFKNKRRDP